MSVTLEQVIEAAEARAASLSADLAGFVLLELAEQLDEHPVRLKASEIVVSQEGRVQVAPGVPCFPSEAEQCLRRLLAAAMAVARTRSPALERLSQGPARDDEPPLLGSLRAALIPLNRAASRRALGRLYRETARAQQAGAPSGDDGTAPRDARANSLSAPAAPQARVGREPLQGPAPSGDPPGDGTLDQDATDPGMALGVAENTEPLPVGRGESMGASPTAAARAEHTVRLELPAAQPVRASGALPALETGSAALSPCTPVQAMPAVRPCGPTPTARSSARPPMQSSSRPLARSAEEAGPRGAAPGPADALSQLESTRPLPRRSGSHTAATQPVTQAPAVRARPLVQVEPLEQVELLEQVEVDDIEVVWLDVEDDATPTPSRPTVQGGVEDGPAAPARPDDADCASVAQPAASVGAPAAEANVGAPAAEASVAPAPAPRRFSARRSGVGDLLADFGGLDERSEGELCEALESIAAVDMTPGPVAASPREERAGTSEPLQERASRRIKRGAAVGGLLLCLIGPSLLRTAIPGADEQPPRAAAPRAAAPRAPATAECDAELSVVGLTPRTRLRLVSRRDSGRRWEAHEAKGSARFQAIPCGHPFDLTLKPDVARQIALRLAVRPIEGRPEGGRISSEIDVSDWRPDRELDELEH